MAYNPQPIDTKDIVLSDEVLELTELLAKHAHDIWAKQRIAEGWTYGPARNDATKTHPDLVPYAELPESEKEYDRITAMETLMVITAMGYEIIRKRR